MITFKQFLEKKCWKGYVKRGTKIKNKRRVNNCVKIREQTRPILSINEKMFIEGIGDVAAKIDSGNEAYNVLHGVDLKINGDNVTFTTVNEIQLHLPVIDTIVIHIGSGVKEERPIVPLNIKVKNQQYQNVPFSIADRSENDEPVLVGEVFLKKINALIDVSV